MARPPLDLTGNKYGRLIPLETVAERSNSGSVLWKCQCECGGFVNARASHLRSGAIKSCGCLIKERRVRADVLPSIPVSTAIYTPPIANAECRIMREIPEVNVIVLDDDCGIDEDVLSILQEKDRIIKELTDSMLAFRMDCITKTATIKNQQNEIGRLRAKVQSLAAFDMDEPNPELFVPLAELATSEDPRSDTDD